MLKLSWTKMTLPPPPPPIGLYLLITILSLSFLKELNLNYLIQSAMMQIPRTSYKLGSLT